MINDILLSPTKLMIIRKHEIPPQRRQLGAVHLEQWQMNHNVLVVMCPSIFRERNACCAVNKIVCRWLSLQKLLWALEDHRSDS